MCRLTFCSQRLACYHNPLPSAYYSQSVYWTLPLHFVSCIQAEETSGHNHFLEIPGDTNVLFHCWVSGLHAHLHCHTCSVTAFTGDTVASCTWLARTAISASLPSIAKRATHVISAALECQTVLECQNLVIFLYLQPKPLLRHLPWLIRISPPSFPLQQDVTKWLPSHLIFHPTIASVSSHEIADYYLSALIITPNVSYL